MYISNATGCSSIWGGPAATSPYTVNKDSKKGPAWANSLFEDNAEHGLGMQIGQEVLRDQAIASAEKCAASDKASAELKAAFDKFVETKNDTKANTPATEALVAELELSLIHIYAILKDFAGGIQTNERVLLACRMYSDYFILLLKGG